MVEVLLLKQLLVETVEVALQLDVAVEAVEAQ